MQLTGEQIVGANLNSSGKSTFQAVNPESGETLSPEFFEASIDEIERAASLAERDFDAFRKMSNEERAHFLDTIAEEIMALGDALIERGMAETGLPQARLVGERGRTVGQLKLFAEVVREGSWAEARIDTALPDRQPLPKPDVRMMNVALGPVAVFGASNFPFAFSVAGGDTASALAAGCPVVVKGHPAHPGVSEMVGRAIQTAVQKCSLPEGVFSLVQGSRVEVGETLVQHPAIKAVGFTGSFRGGKALFDLAAARPEPIPVYAEMGSANPVFILPTSLKNRGDAIAQGLAGSITLGVGQFCTNPGLTLSQSGEEFEILQKKLAQAIDELPAGTMLHQGIKNAYDAGFQTAQGVAGVTQVAGAQENGDKNCQGAPRLLRTDGNTFLEQESLEEEIFGPASLLVACDSREQMLRVAENLHGHLTATIHGEDDELTDYADLLAILERKVGRIIFNGYPTGVEVCHSMMHGGPFPATTDSRTTSVGTAAIKRFLRPVSYQDFPQAMLPPPLQNQNPDNQWRLVNGAWTQENV